MLVPPHDISINHASDGCVLSATAVHSTALVILDVVATVGTAAQVVVGREGLVKGVGFSTGCGGHRG